jgi:hypothetical protein
VEQDKVWLGVETGELPVETVKRVVKEKLARPKEMETKL